MNFKKLTAFTLAMVLAIGAVGCADKTKDHSVEAIKARGKIIIATESQYAPFCFKDKEGNYKGLEPLLMQAIADDLGVELEIMDIDFASVVPTVQAGGADLGLSGLTPDEKRKAAVNFTDFYNKGGQALVINVADKDTYTTIESLKGKTLAVQEGSLQKMIADEQFPDCKQLVLPAVPNAAEELKAGSVQGVLMDDVSATQYVRLNADKLMIADIPVEIADDIAGTAGAIMKGNDDLSKYLNDLIARLWTEGKLDAWFEAAKEEALTLGVL